jgi:acetyl esterase/lipase
MKPEGTAGQSRRSGVAAVIDFYGPTDLVALSALPTAAGRSTAVLIGGPADERAAAHAESSPVRGVGPGSAPVLILHGTEDRIVPLDQSLALDRDLEGAGVLHRLIVIKGARHGFGLETGGRDLAPDVLDFLAQVWGTSSGLGKSGRGVRR